MLPSPAQHNVLVSLMNEDNEVTNTHHLCLMIYDKGLQVMKVACGVVKKGRSLVWWIDALGLINHD